MFLFDAHLDLAMNAIESNRDLTRPLADLRRDESGMSDKPDRGRGTVSLPEMRRAGIGLCVATQIARINLGNSPIFGWQSQSQAWAMTQAQRAWYESMTEAGEMAPVTDLASLDRQVALWMKPDGSLISAGSEPDRRPVGFILSLEGADSLVTVGHLERSYAAGLRAIGPAHYGPGVYAFGTDSSGGFNARGRELLKEIERLGMILDATHLCDVCFWEALDAFQGPVWASHNNLRELVPHNRQFSDDMVRELIRRGAVIGSVFDAWMMVPGWVRGKTTPVSAGLKLERIVDHIDRICQLAGNARHVGIGSDLDGAFGHEQTPQDLNTIADLQRLPGLLAARGYSAADVRGIMHGNFIEFLRRAWR